MTEQAVATAGDAHDRAPLDDVMLAMDVVDTLRRAERLVLKELDEAGREQELKQRLKRIYAQQGIQVPDHVIEQGVAALKEDRFTYKPPQGGIVRRLAHLYVSRGRWGKWAVGALAAVVLALTANYFMFVAPDRALPDELNERHTELMAIAASDHARSIVQQVLGSGNLAVRNEEYDVARDVLAQQEQLRNTLEQVYTIQIVNRPGERSGIWRIPDVNETARNYYIIVEAVNSAGQRQKVSIRNEETGRTVQTETWGLRVDQMAFDAVGRDKQNDGIIQNNRFGSKQRGYLKPEYEMPTSGDAITDW